MAGDFFRYLPVYASLSGQPRYRGCIIVAARNPLHPEQGLTVSWMLRATVASVWTRRIALTFSMSDAGITSTGFRFLAKWALALTQRTPCL